MLIPPKPLTPAQIKLQAMLAKARANLAASSVAQVQAVQALVVANDVHDIDLSNVVPAKATEAEKEEALDAVISAQSVELSSSAVASAGSEATEGVFPPRASAAPPPVVGSARWFFERDLGGVYGQAVV